MWLGRPLMVWANLLWCAWLAATVKAHLVLQFDGSYVPAESSFHSCSAPVASCGVAIFSSEQSVCSGRVHGKAASSGVSMLGRDISTGEARKVVAVGTRLIYPAVSTSALVGRKSDSSSELNTSFSSANAEYEALVLGLDFLLSRYFRHPGASGSEFLDGHRQLVIQGDCKTVMDQLWGRSTPRKLQHQYEHVQRLLQEIERAANLCLERNSSAYKIAAPPFAVKFQRIPRKHNILADALCKEAIRTAQMAAVQDARLRMKSIQPDPNQVKQSTPCLESATENIIQRIKGKSPDGSSHESAMIARGWRPRLLHELASSVYEAGYAEGLASIGIALEQQAEAAASVMLHLPYASAREQNAIILQNGNQLSQSHGTDKRRQRQKQQREDKLRRKMIRSTMVAEGVRLRMRSMMMQKDGNSATPRAKPQRHVDDAEVLASKHRHLLNSVDTLETFLRNNGDGNQEEGNISFGNGIYPPRTGLHTTSHDLDSDEYDANHIVSEWKKALMLAGSDQRNLPSSIFGDQGTLVNEKTPSVESLPVEVFKPNGFFVNLPR